MALNRGQLRIEDLDPKGPRTVHFVFSTLQMLEDRLGCSVMAWLVNAKGDMSSFCAKAIHCGLVKQDRKLSQIDVYTWFDTYQGDVDTLGKDLLYTIARAKPVSEGEQMIKQLDVIFGGGALPEGDGDPFGADGSET